MSAKILAPTDQKLSEQRKLNEELRCEARLKRITVSEAAADIKVSIRLIVFVWINSNFLFSSVTLKNTKVMITSYQD